MYTEVLVQGTGKLVQRRRHLEALLEDTALALDAHDLGPLDKPVQVLLGWKGTTNTELLQPLLEEQVGNLLQHQPNATKSMSNQAMAPYMSQGRKEECDGVQHILFSSWLAPAPCHLASGPADLIQGLSTLLDSYTDFSKISSGNIMPPKITIEYD